MQLVSELELNPGRENSSPSSSSQDQSNASSSSTAEKLIPHLRTLLALYLFTFNSVIQTSFTILNCIQITSAGESFNLVRNYPAVSCSDESYRPLYIGSVFYLLLYVAVVPIFLIWHVRRAGPQDFMGLVTVRITTPFHSAWYQKSWEFWRLVQRLVLIVVIVFEPDLNT
jgi:hypothetical protein